MPSLIQKSLLAALAAATSVLAHGYAKGLYVDGEFIKGFSPVKHPYMANPPDVIGWAESATDKGFVLPSAYGTRDIACHLNSENAKLHATVAAGSDITVEWDTWPPGHKGPIMTYLADCGSSSCEEVDVGTLKFFKIEEEGLMDDGRWAPEKLRADDLKWNIHIPGSIKAGSYVMRHEIIALHSAFDANGAQNYPQCFNLEITGGGSATPDGVKATELYSADDEGILFNLYYPTPTTYPIPGPTVWKDDGSGSGSSSSSSKDATTSTKAATTTTKVAATTSTKATPTTSTKATTTSTKAAPTASPATTTTAKASTSSAATQPKPSDDCLTRRKARRAARKARRDAVVVVAQ